MQREIKKLVAATLSLVVASAAVLSGISPLEVYAADQEQTVQKEFYVTPDGKDSNPGTKERPFGTISRAQNEVRKINKDMVGDILVNVGAGEYYISEPILMDERDSGSNGYEVVYQSSDGIGQARVIGGDKITQGWVETTEEDKEYDLDESLIGKVYKVQLDPEIYNFNTLYVNDEKAVMARTRNHQEEARFTSQQGEYLLSAGGGAQDIVYREGDVDQKSIDGMVHAQQRGEKEIAQLYVWDGGDWDWFTSTLSLGSIDPQQRNIRAWTVDGKPEINRTKYSVQSNARYYLQGNLAFMDIPGEYHYNKSTGVLYYYPKEGEEDLSRQNVVVPRTKEIFRFQGSDKAEIKDYAKEPDFTRQVSNVRLNGLSLECTDFTEWISSGWNSYDAAGNLGGTIPPEAEGSTNTSYCEQTDRTEFKVGAITMINSNHLTVENCKITNIGLFGIALWRDNTFNTVKNCEISNIGYGGITTDGGYPGIGRYNNHHLFTNLCIHDVGKNVGHGTGITVMSTGQSEFSHIEIYNAPRRAMMVSGGIRRNMSLDRDGKYDEMKEMYTVGNTFENFYIHHCEQDSGEDSAVYICMLLRGNELAKRYNGISDPLKIVNPETGEPYGMEKANIFNQILIDSVGATPSMHDKNTVHGMDLAMGGSGTHLWNIKGTNQQSCTLRFEEANNDRLYVDNCNNNYKNDYWYDRFDDSRMEYDEIGLTEEYPFGKYEEPDISIPEDVYFSDDFETGNSLNYRKWTTEKGKAYLSKAYMAEGPYHGRKALCIDGDQSGGVVVSRKFENDLNKIVTLKYFDKRLDYATSDRNEGSSPTNILPHTFVRVDRGEEASQIALGADGDVSKDYYLYKNGKDTVKTNVHRTFGWHEFQFDYSSDTEVKLSIDGVQVALLPAESFNYIAMGDWNGQGGKIYIDQIYIHGGKQAPPAEDLPMPKPPAEPDSVMYQEDFEADDAGEVFADDSDAGEKETEIKADANKKETLAEYRNQEVTADYNDQVMTSEEQSEESISEQQDEGLTSEKQSDEPISEKQDEGLTSEQQSVKPISEQQDEGLTSEQQSDEPISEQQDVGLTSEQQSDEPISEKQDEGLTSEQQSDEPISEQQDEGLTSEQQSEEAISEQPNEKLSSEQINNTKLPELQDDVLPDWKVRGKGAVSKKRDKDPQNENNHVLYAQSQDNTLYYPPTKMWANYTMECKVWVDSWSGGLEGDKPWDNFAVSIYVDGENSGNRYALKFNRTGGFEAYRRSGGDATLGKASAAELGIIEQNENHTGQWYKVKVITKPGDIKMYVDDKEAFHVEDSSMTSGGIGFDGINVKYYVDDIKVTASATEDPDADKKEGIYEGKVSLTLNPADKGDKIFYTTDGSDPKDPEHGKYYFEGDTIELTQNTVLKFVAIHDGQLYSNVVTRRYTIKKAETGKLKEARNKVPENLDEYTKATADKVRQLADKADALLNRTDLTSEDQPEIDMVTNDLLDAIDHLVKNVDIPDNEELQEALKKAEEARKQAEEAQKKAEEARKQAELARNQALLSQEAANNAERQAKKAQAEAEKKAKEAEEARKAAEKILAEMRGYQSNGKKVGKVSIKSVKSSKRGQFKVVWAKKKGISGYEVQYSTNSKFKGAKRKTVGKDKVSLTIKNLKSKKNYYVRVRAYTRVKDKKINGHYSSYKKLKIR
ncbi:FN3 associated domain-containing protein [Robinsoniella sp. KNHs210]|uniref:FN3 associated domain-containing protein n=1 Tax=Robinsoniella sp. KNHs210 TaxID=1469950 RepID=UPI0004883146|nr:chitobiase/beta-hexosaminidase C-terminal domain-containing protein [Robinsoniella sp. KNHs210]